MGQPESAAAHCGCQRRLGLRAWRRWRGRCVPGRPWQPGHCLALRARRRRRGRCAPGRHPTCAPRVTAHVVSWGEWGCRRSRVLRAAREAWCKACFELPCRGRGWGGTPRGPCCHRLRHARAEHRYGGSWQAGGARAASPPLQGLAPPARRPRAAGAPWEARARATCVQTAGEDLWWWWWQQLRITSGRLPLIGGSTLTYLPEGGPTRTSADVSVPRLAGFSLIT